MRLLPSSVLAVVVPAMATAAAADTRFTEVAQAAGISGETYKSVSIHATGACWIDYDNDLLPDLFLTNGYSRASHLFTNNGDGTFSPADDLLPDLLIAAGEISGCVFADYDNDGDSDLYVLKSSHQWSIFEENDRDGARNLLLQNRWIENGGQTVPGQALFQEVAAAAAVDGVVDPPFGGNYDARRTMTAGWLDYDLDGCVDLFAGQMTLQAEGDPSNLDTLYHNECDGTFEDVTAIMNPGTDEESVRPALAFIGAHLDGDMWPDMFIVNAHEPPPYFEDQLYQNGGGTTFNEILGGMTGLGDDSGSGMGIDVADIDLNGTWDVYITDRLLPWFDAEPRGNVLYLGTGGGAFQDNNAPEAGVAADFSWGTNFFDADHDGDEDLVVGQKTGLVYYRNDGAGGFDQPDVGIAAAAKVMASAVADYDRDGDLDVVVLHHNAPASLYRNDSTGSGNWLEIKLVGVDSNRDAVNAKVVLTANGQTQMRQVKGGSSAHSQDDLVVHFGVGSTTSIDSIEVFWPHGSGIVDELHDVGVNQLITISEGATLAPCELTPDLVVANQEIDAAELFEACLSIDAGPDLMVTDQGALTLRAGKQVTLSEGIAIAPGGSLIVEIDAGVGVP